MIRTLLPCLAWLVCAPASAEETVAPPNSWAPLFARVVRADGADGVVTLRYRDSAPEVTVRTEVVRKKGVADEDVNLPKRQVLQGTQGWKLFEVKLRAQDFRLRTAEGGEVEREAVWERLRPGAALLYAKKGKLDPVYLPAFRPDALILTPLVEPARVVVAEDEALPEEPPPTLALFKAADPEGPVLETVHVLPEDVHHSVEGGDPDRGKVGKVVATPLKEPLYSESRAYYPAGYRLVVTDGAGRPVEGPWRKLKRGQLIVVADFDQLPPFYRGFLNKDVFVISARRPE